MGKKPVSQDVLQANATAQERVASSLAPGVAEKFREGNLSEAERLAILAQVMEDDDQLQELLFESPSPDQGSLNHAHIQASWESFQQRLASPPVDVPPLANTVKPKSLFSKLQVWQFATAALFFFCALLISLPFIGPSVSPQPYSTSEARVRDIFFQDGIRGAENEKLAAKATTLRLHLAPAWPKYGRYSVEILNAESRLLKAFEIVPDAYPVLTLTLWSDNAENWRTYTLKVFGESDLEKKELGVKKLVLSSIEG